jgi:hypothetical protein
MKVWLEGEAIHEITRTNVLLVLFSVISWIVVTSSLVSTRTPEFLGAGPFPLYHYQPFQLIPSSDRRVIYSGSKYG